MTQPQQYLHSIMVQLLFLSPTKPSERSLIYIPLWFNYYSYRFCQRKPSDSIYIPLWFNYYQDGVLKTHDTPAFTFHYGSITILKTINRANKERIFTFHYGSITIWWVCYGIIQNVNLHSIMVQLLSVPYYIPHSLAFTILFLSTLIFFTHFYLYTKNKFK